MKRDRITWLAAVAVLAIFATGVPANAATGIRIARVDLRGYPTIRLTVVTPDNRSQPPKLEENGTSAVGLDVENLGREESVVLAIDRSHSMRGDPLAHAVGAARDLLVTKANSDRVSFVTFASQAVQLTNFSTSTIDADAALRSIAIDPRSGTTMYDAVVVAANALKRSGTLGRAIILITDGQEATSKASLKQAITAARDARASLYVVAIEDASFKPRALRALAASTGGRMLLARPNQPLTGIYAKVDSLFRNTWQMTYVTAVRPGRRLHLTASLPGIGTATTTVTVPGSATRPKSHSNLPFTVIGMAAFALVPVVLAMIAAFRMFQRRNVWTGF